MTRLIIRAATPHDVETVLGGRPTYSMRAIAAIKDEECIGICGVQHGQYYDAFSTITDEMRKYPGAIWRAAVKFRNLLNQYEGAIYARAGEPTAPDFLERIGFKHIGGDMYQWPTP